MSPQSLASQGSPALSQPESLSLTKLAGLEGDRLTYYQELRRTKFLTHLLELNGQSQHEIKQPLAFCDEVYKGDDLSALELDKLATGIETAFNDRFPKHPLPPGFHQRQISVEYWSPPGESNVLLGIRLLMKEVQQENGPVIPRHRSTPVGIRQYLREVTSWFLNR